jgi:hypothetical protein
VYEPKGFVIAAVVAACANGSSTSAQEDAAQKAKEGSIDHWIEYYKEQQSRLPAPPRQAPAEHPPTEPGRFPEPTSKSVEPVEKSTAPK